MTDRPKVERYRLLSSEAIISHLTYGDARAMLERAEDLKTEEARELAGELAGPTASRSKLLDTIATMLASGELVAFADNDPRGTFDLPPGVFDDLRQEPTGR